jgi:hypothetical protein
MAKKPVTTKKVAKKAVKKAVSKVVAPVQEPVQVLDLHKSFDLTDVSQETLSSYAFYLKEMTHSAGWKLMVQVLEGNLAVLERQIVRKKEILTNRPLTEVEVDRLRDQHEILSELINKPKELIDQYSVPTEQAGSPSYDPYGGDKKTVNAAVMSDST